MLLSLWQIHLSNQVNKMSASFDVNTNIKHELKICISLHWIQVFFFSGSVLFLLKQFMIKTIIMKTITILLQAH